MCSETCLKRTPHGTLAILVRFTENKGEKLVFTEADVRLMQPGVRLIWGPLNTCFTVLS